MRGTKGADGWSREREIKGWGEEKSRGWKCWFALFPRVKSFFMHTSKKAETLHLLATTCLSFSNCHVRLVSASLKFTWQKINRTVLFPRESKLNLCCLQNNLGNTMSVALLLPSLRNFKSILMMTDRETQGEKDMTTKLHQIHMCSERDEAVKWNK